MRALGSVLAVVLWPVLAPIRWLRGVQAGVSARTEAVHSAPRERDHRMAPERV